VWCRAVAEGAAVRWLRHRGLSPQQGGLANALAALEQYRCDLAPHIVAVKERVKTKANEIVHEGVRAAAPLEAEQALEATADLLEALYRTEQGKVVPIRPGGGT
jgi:hypothetical protein